MSLNEMILKRVLILGENSKSEPTYILMPEMLEQFELAIRPLAQHGGRKGLHDLLDRNRCPRELVLRRTARGSAM